MATMALIKHTVSQMLNIETLYYDIFGPILIQWCCCWSFSNPEHYFQSGYFD